jgi:hypothetical protein
VELFKRNYLTMGVEHDPRIPPIERSYMPGHLQVIYDRSYDNAEDLARDQFVCCHAERRHCSAVRWKAVRSLLA